MKALRIERPKLAIVRVADPTVQEPANVEAF